MVGQNTGNMYGKKLTIPSYKLGYKDVHYCISKTKRFQYKECG
jgi:hypothetical protein